MAPRSLVLLFVLVAVSWATQERTVIKARPHVALASGPLSAEDLVNLRARSRSRSASLQYFDPANELWPIYDISGASTLGAGKTIAVIDAYGASTAEADLATFSSQNGLPAITSTNFKKVDQTGGTDYPPDDTTGNWGIEAALDVQAAHLFAPGANILLVVCNSDEISDLFVGIQYAIENADYISMSWGASESGLGSSGVSTLENTFEGSTKSFFASTGDDGEPSTGINYPASSRYVVAVGGTSVYSTSDPPVFSSEEGWSGSGGGCSQYTTALSVQTSTAGYGCNGKKSLPDLSLVADPNSGIVIVVTQPGPCSSPPCYFIAGGTSLSSPLIAARAAIRGVQVTPSYIYSSSPPITFRDITTGNDGSFSCQTGLDKVTGRGSWIGAS